MRVDFRTDVGVVRESNQDSCDCGLFGPSSAWVLVCDGMGGAAGGDTASSLALETLREQLLTGFREGLGEGNLKSLILNAIARANDRVYQLSLQRPELRGMGTTAVVILAAGGKLHVAHVGDSRAYLKRKGDSPVEQITMDHSYVQDLVNLGQITPEEARQHPHRNIITRVLGGHEAVQPDYQTLDFSPGDLVLACSDGLSNYTGPGELETFIQKAAGDTRVLVDSLIDHAVASGGADNITAAVLLHDGPED